MRTLQEGYRPLVTNVMTCGDRVNVRGRWTRELQGSTLHIDDVTGTYPRGIGRKLNKRIAAVEALQLIGGVLHPELMVRASRNFAQFMDGGTFHGGYGQRIRSQLPAVVKRLQADYQTRQAVMTIWDPLWDLFTDGVKDYPCTLSLQFLGRSDGLHMHVTMRSNDVWLGLPYDAFMFTQLQQVVAACLDVPAAGYHHHANSFHLYEDDVDKVGEMLEVPFENVPRFRLGSLVHPGTPIEDAMMIARRILKKEPTYLNRSVEGVASWYREALA